MSPEQCFMLMGVGSFFLVLGIVMVILGKREQKSYYDKLSSRTDVREYLEHWPKRPQLGALKVGGWIAMAIGLVMLVVGGIFLLRG